MSWRRAALAAVVGLTLAGWPAPASAQPDTRPLSLVTTYADGRVSESLVGPNGFRAFTATFPRLPGWTDARNVVPVTALHLVATAEGDGLRVWVSVLRGRAREIDQPIAEVVVGVDAPAVVDGLRRVGLSPITLSAKLFAAPALPVPRGDSRVPGLVIEGIEPSLDPTPGYVITVRNQTDVPVVTLVYDTSGGGLAALSGQEGEPAAQPVVLPGDAYTFRLGIRSSPMRGGALATALPLDHVVVTGAIWADGRRNGDPSRLAPLLALQRGRLTAVQRVIAILRQQRGTTDPLDEMRRVRAAIAAIPIAAEPAAVATVMRLLPAMSPVAATDVEPGVSMGSQNVRQRLLADLDRVAPTLTPADARQWLDEALPACEAWLARLQVLFRWP